MRVIPCYLPACRINTTRCRQRPLKDFSMPPKPVPDTIVDFLREAAERHGPRDALLIKPAFRYIRWTYERLWEDSGRVATLLQRRGLSKGDQVILWGPNSPHWVLAFFGCLRAGVVLIPLDLRSAPDYVSRVISRTEPKLAFTSRFTPKGRCRPRRPGNHLRRAGVGHSRSPLPRTLYPSNPTTSPKLCSPPALPEIPRV